MENTQTIDKTDKVFIKLPTFEKVSLKIPPNEPTISLQPRPPLKVD